MSDNAILPPAKARLEATLATYGKPFQGTMLTREAAEQLRQQCIGSRVDYEGDYGKKTLHITSARIEGNEQYGDVVIVAEEVSEDAT